MLETVILTVICVAFVIVLWSLYCNTQTFRDRKHRLNSIRVGAPDFHEQMDRFQSVSYEDHFRARLLFQKPDQLYEKDL